MATWTLERASDFAVMQSEWGVELSRNGLTATCIKTPDITDRGMMPSAYLTDVRSTFDLLRADWIRLEMGNRSQFVCGDINYEVTRFRDDAADATIQFDATRLK